MPDSHIQVPVDPVAKKLATDTITNALGDLVHREWMRVAGDAAAELADVRNTDPTLADHGAVVRILNVVGPVRDRLTSAALAAGASVNLDGTTIAAAKTGKLMEVEVGSSVACRWDIKSRDGAVELTFATLFTGGLASGRPSRSWTPPDKRFTVLLGNGIDENFRVTATNLDAENPADVFTTIFWDEV